MKKFKIKPRSKFYKTYLSTEQQIRKHYQLRLKRLKTKLHLNINKCTLNVLKSKVHSAIGKSHGRISIRHRKSVNYKQIRKTFLPNRCFFFKVAAFVYNPKQSIKSLSLVIGDKNVASYSSTFFGSEIGRTVFNFNYRKVDYFASQMRSFKKRLMGATMPLSKIATGSLIYNLEKNPFKGPAYIRSQGCKGKLMAKKRLRNVGYGLVLLPSSQQIYVDLVCRASIGRFFFQKHKYKTAGFLSRKGRRPVVRGVAMNPVDHPHGGGEGKKSNPATPKTPWGTAGKWVKTRSLKKDLIKKKFIFKLRTLGYNIT